MKSEKLTLATLENASPEAFADFQALLLIAVQDCKQRPSCTKARKVVLTFQVTPRETDPEDVLIEPVITSRSPARSHEAFVARTSRNNQQLIFDFPELEEEE